MLVFDTNVDRVETDVFFTWYMVPIGLKPDPESKCKSPPGWGQLLPASAGMFLLHYYTQRWDLSHPRHVHDAFDEERPQKKGGDTFVPPHDKKNILVTTYYLFTLNVTLCVEATPD